MSNKKLVFILVIAAAVAIIFLMLIQKTKTESAPKTQLSETIIPVNTIPTAQEIADNIKDTERKEENFEKMKDEIENEKIRGSVKAQAPETDTSNKTAAQSEDILLN